MKLIKTLISLIWLMALLVSCSSKKDGKDKVDRTAALPTIEVKHEFPDTLVVGTIYSPASFFTLKGDTLGYDYERICRFARQNKMHVKFHVATSMKELISFVENNKVHVAAYEIPITAEYKQHVIHCGEQNVTYQVLVQPLSKDSITNVIQLIGKDVYVIHGSSYEARLRNLDSEIGGGIKIHAIDNDSLLSEDLINMVASHRLPLTIADSDIAQINKTYNDSINISLKVGFPQRASWAVGKDWKWLADTINTWAKNNQTIASARQIRQRYFEMNKHHLDSMRALSDSVSTIIEQAKKQSGTVDYAKLYKRGTGDISAYDRLFKKYAATAGVEWTVLAAVAYVESNFNPSAVSWAGARGLMQIMPKTAAGYGFSEEDLADPEKSVYIASLILSKSDKFLQSYIGNRAERLRFQLGAYNAGMGHVTDAMRLAQKYGKKPQVWYSNVEEAVLWKMRPEFYNDPVCSYGYCRGTETVNYVRQVENAYRVFSQYAAQRQRKK
ncbi:MAG: transglycosylase SLT domain-containing protein [Muribaculaceae bacterium]|nr:transglycosylase SLT domain-containing protein [Muribaculaceae bacterium]